MNELLQGIITQSILFLPLAFGISISYHLLRATDMTLDGSFVVGAGVFARLVTLGISPMMATIIALACGGIAGMLTATIQRNGRIDPLLAGILAAFILNSLNLIIMNKPNINLLSQTTLFSHAFSQSEVLGWIGVCVFVLVFCAIMLLILKSHFGLALKAFGDNPTLLKRLGKNIEAYRLLGFALTNTLAACSGCLTTQTIGYADTSMGLGMTLTGIGAIIIGHHVLTKFNINPSKLRTQFAACLCGVILYFFTMNVLLSMDVNPMYFKMILGLTLIIFLRSAARSQQGALV